MNRFIRYIRSHAHIGVWIVLLVISVLPLVDLFTPGLPVTHDGRDHVARIANFYQSFSEGNIVPRWGARLNWGYGHPILMFLYPFPSYVASVFHAVGFSFVDSTKLVFAVLYIASIAAMYLWAGTAWGAVPGAVAAILYGFAPYRFVDLYVRGAIGEHAAFVFPPLLCFALLGMAKKKQDFAVGPVTILALSTGLLILAHNALSLMFLPIVALYAIYLAFFETRHPIRFLLTAAIAVGFGFLFAAFFWVPAFFEGKYTLRDIVTAGSVKGRFVPLLDFFYSPWSYGYSPVLSKWLGIGPIMGFAASLYLFTREERNPKLSVILIGSYAVLLVAIGLMLEWSLPVWDTVTLLQKFQFPWRFLSVTTLMLAVVGAFATVAVPNKLRNGLAAMLIVISIGSTVIMWHAHEYKQYAPGYFAGVYSGTTDTGESSPIWSVRFMEHEPGEPISVIDGDARIYPKTRTTTRHTYEAIASAKTRIVENTLYFPGWAVYVDGNTVPVEFQDPAFRGLLTFDIPKGTHTITVQFTDTRLRQAADMISVVSMVVFLGVLGTILLWPKRKK